MGISYITPEFEVLLEQPARHAQKIARHAITARMRWNVLLFILLLLFIFLRIASHLSTCNFHSNLFPCQKISRRNSGFSVVDFHEKHD